ncbi:rubrerythrin [Flavonifractor sp. AGMB03687]|uniref:rubrerythrin n=1 Tax=Flavonifractor sp. AGMB03687 TaxID=2785133 RepID=UPI001AE09725|nr:rubrerythrin [Flavonifractor sp. AGMB03687]
MDQEWLPNCDREVFARVWKRVMPDQREDCPFEVVEAAQQTLPAVVVPDPPAAEEEEGTVCLGPASAVHGPQLQQYIDQELAAHRCCQMLARRVPGNGGRMLATLAAEQRRRAKRLSTAYFLISGVRYWPADRSGSPVNGPVTALLREQFQAKQGYAACYRAAAAGTADPCLEALFHESADEAEAHAWVIRNVLEQM